MNPAYAVPTGWAAWVNGMLDWAALMAWTFATEVAVGDGPRRLSRSEGLVLCRTELFPAAEEVDEFKSVNIHEVRDLV